MSGCCEVLSPETRTVVHWFRLWNQEQRHKFLTHLRGSYVPQSPALELCNRLDLFWIASESQETFQCQIRKFDEYFATWSLEQKHVFLQKLSEIDPVLVGRFRQSLF